MPALDLAPDLICCNAAIGACARAGEPAQAENVLRQVLVASGVTPDTKSYNGLLTAHANAQPAGSSDEGKRLAKRKKTSDLVFQRNSDLSGAVEPWSPGTLAVVAGPDHFVDQVVSHLTLTKGYPADCVVYF